MTREEPLRIPAPFDQAVKAALSIGPPPEKKRRGKKPPPETPETLAPAKT
jgi:hypothetical protein